MPKLIGTCFISCDEHGKRFSSWNIGKGLCRVGARPSIETDPFHLRGISLVSGCSGFVSAGRSEGGFCKETNSTEAVFHFNSRTFLLNLPTKPSESKAATFFEDGTLLLGTYIGDDSLIFELLKDGRGQPPSSYDLQSNYFERPIDTDDANALIEMLS